MKKTKGFTLIELIIAMVIIAITAVVSLEFFVLCQKSFISPAKPKIMAANFARETMEQYAWSPSTILTASPCPLPDTGDFSELSSVRYGGTRAATVSTNSQNGYKIVEVTVTWTR